MMKQICKVILFFRTFLDLCPSAWIPSASSGTCIKPHDTMASWGDARKRCKENDGDLVIVVDKKMNEFLLGKTFTVTRINNGVVNFRHQLKPDVRPCAI